MPRRAMAGGEPLEPPRAKQKDRRLRDSPIVPMQQDERLRQGIRRRLPNQSLAANRVGPSVHQQALRHPMQSLEPPPCSHSSSRGSAKSTTESCFAGSSGCWSLPASGSEREASSAGFVTWYRRTRPTRGRATIQSCSRISDAARGAGAVLLLQHLLHTRQQGARVHAPD